MPQDAPPKDVGFVLIHGGGFGPWVWGRVTPLLNLPALAVHRADPIDLELSVRSISLADCAEFVQAEIEAAGFQEVILVAHSIGGVIAPEVATRLPERIKHMVFIAANIPPEGKRPLDVLPFKDRWINRVAIILQAWGLSMSDKQIEHAVRNVLCHDVDEAGIQLVLERGVTPEPPALAFTRIYRANTPDLPRTYIKLLQDRTLALETQDQMAENLGQANVVTIDTGHTAMLSRPQALADILNQIAEQMKFHALNPEAPL
jgi:pimeloyl-ACP methyl ester carboxylesterase